MVENDSKPASTRPNVLPLDSLAASLDAPSSPIELLFVRFLAIYGARFSRLWAGSDPEEVKRTWTEQLKRFEAAQVAKAVDLCASEVDHPPTLPEFVKLVRSCHIPRPVKAFPALAGVVLPDEHENQVVREYPREGGPPWLYWAKRILRLNALGARVHFRSVQIAREALGVATSEEFAVRYPPQ